MATMTAERIVARQDRETRRQRIADEQHRLDTAREAEANTRRVARLEVEKARRVAAAIAASSTVEFTVPNGDMTYRIRLTLGAEGIARSFARAATIALAHLLVMLDGERIEAARVNGPGPDIARRLAIVLDGDGCRQAQAHGVLTAEMKGE